MANEEFITQPFFSTCTEKVLEFEGIKKYHKILQNWYTTSDLYKNIIVKLNNILRDLITSNFVVNCHYDMKQKTVNIS